MRVNRSTADKVFPSVSPASCRLSWFNPRHCSWNHLWCVSHCICKRKQVTIQHSSGLQTLAVLHRDLQGPVPLSKCRWPLCWLKPNAHRVTWCDGNRAAGCGGAIAISVVVPVDGGHVLWDMHVAYATGARWVYYYKLIISYYYNLIILGSVSGVTSNELITGPSPILL